MKRNLPALVSVVVVAGVLVLLPFVLSGYNTFLAGEVGIYFIAVLGLNILTGYTGQISIGHGAFMAIGGYTMAVMSRDHHTNLVYGTLVAFAFCFVVGLLFGLPALRLSGAYLALATFALALSVTQLPLQWSNYLGGSLGVQASSKRGDLFGWSLPGVAVLDNRWIYGVSWAFAAILLLLAWLILRGRVGRAFRAVRDSEIAAVASGVERGLYKVLAFGISAAYCGVAGALLVLASNGFAQPDVFGVTLSLTLLIGAAVAGLGSLWGILVGAAFVGLLPNIASSVPHLGGHEDVIYGAVVIGVMLVLPTGFAGLLARLRLLGRGLNRESIPVKLPERTS
jgi:branched-chain amino acid transport system permease protein